MAVDTDPSTQQHAIVIVCIVAPTICTLFVAMRIWTRICVSHSTIGWDDCRSPRLLSPTLFSAASLLHLTDAGIATLVGISLCQRDTHRSPNHPNRTAFGHSL